jgi:putative spermidine/putrescine transport system substrate-binding protein
MEYLYSDEGQNAWLRGLARPVRQAAMEKSGKVDSAAAAKLPKVNGKPVFLTDSQATKAKDYLASKWAQAIG